ncbi:hypothetical protein GCM10007198_29330 [Microbacterium aerolatum]|uniref:Uncharacterized protein n=1 Tax=Microbacterium aerolatum TaxID=153731 RepID=A0A511AA38_9MICO|nr:hypothetical protein MAE01_00520 [Microbacterium aerolatum]GGB36895.1 hypothetical protein GCM10007198_29330 [Microbacterium aerolatum]
MVSCSASSPEAERGGYSSKEKGTRELSSVADSGGISLLTSGLATTLERACIGRTICDRMCTRVTSCVGRRA